MKMSKCIQLMDELNQTSLAKKKSIKVRVGKKKDPIKEKNKEQKLIDKRDEIFPGSKQLTQLSRGIFEAQELQITIERFLQELKKVLDYGSHRDVEKLERGLEDLGYIRVENTRNFCNRQGYQDQEQFLKTQNAYNLAASGKLLDKETKN
jgi:hypothetical protein